MHIILLILIVLTITGIAPYRPPVGHEWPLESAIIAPRRWRSLKPRRCPAPPG